MSSTESKPTAASTLASSTSILTPSSESAAGTMSSAFPHVQLADANDDAQVVEKVEQLLSRQNLANDSYLVSKMKDDMYIPLEVLVSSPGLLAAFGGVTIELERLKHLLSASTLVSLSADKSLIKPNFSLHRHTVILRDLPASFTTEDIQKLLEASSVDAKVAQIRCEVGCWFVAFESQEDAAAALKSVRQQKINGVSVAARLKSESLLRSTSSRSRHAATAAAAQASSSDSSSTSSSPSPLPHHQGGAKAAGIPFYPYYAPWYGYPGGPAPHPDSHLPPHPSLGYPQHGQQLAPGGHPIHGAPVFDGSVGHPGQHVQTSPRSSATSSSASTTSSRPHTHGGHPSAPGGGRSKGGPSSAYGAVGGQRGSGSKPSSQGGVGPAGKRRTGGRPSAPGSGAGGKPEGYAPSASSPSSTTSTSSSGSQGAAGGQQRKGRVPRTGGPAGGRDGEYSHHPHHHHSSSSHPRAEQAAPKREAVPLTAQNFPPLSGSASAEKTPAASTWTKEGVTLVRAPPPQAAKPIAVPKPAATSAPVAATPAASAVAETPVAAQQTTASPIPSPSPAVQSPAAAVATAPAAAAAPAPAPASTPVASTLAPATASPAPAAVATSPIAAPAATPSAAPVSAAPAPTPATPATVAGAAPTKPLWASIAAKKPTSVAQ